MLDLVLCEFYKFKRKGILNVAALSALIFPFFNSMLLADGDFTDMMSGVREDSGFILLIPILVILASYLFFEEHDNNTLKNLVCIPIFKSQLVIAKIFVLLIFSVSYELIGFAASVMIAISHGVPLADFGLQLLLTIGTGILLLFAALPCVIFVVWFNKSYIISVIAAFFYTLLNFALHLSDKIMMKPFGFNLGTLLPVPMIFRWLYQYNVPEGEVRLAFYNRFSPYFASPAICFGVLAIEAVICTLLIVKVYQRQED